MKMKTRILAVSAFLALMFVGIFSYILITGNCCTVDMSNVQRQGLKSEDLYVEIEDPSVAEVKELKASGVTTVIDEDVDYKAAFITFHSLKSGKTTAAVFNRSYNEDENKYELVKNGQTLKLIVLPWGTIVETSYLTFSGWKLLEYGILIAVGIIAVAAFLSFIECIFKANYSYSMVACLGVASYCAFMLILSLYDMQYFNNFRSFLINISDTGQLFFGLTSPVMLLICAATAFSNIWLLRHEGFRPQNMLGIGLAVFWAFGLAFVVGLLPFLNPWSIFDYNTWNHIVYMLAYVFSFLECMLVSTGVCAFLSTRYTPPRNKDYLIILGCGIRKDGTLTPILRGRVDAAIRFEQRQFSETGKHAKFVPSGGQGSDEVISESEAMKRYLVEQGYPEEQIVKEDKSVNTDQNISFSRDRILEDGGTLENVKAAFATTNYHIFRGYILSRKHGLDAQGISAKTKWYFFPNAFLREFAGLLVDKKFQIGAIIFAILALNLIGTYLITIV